MTQESYKILNLHVENVKRVQVVDITPQDNMVVIAGNNGEGKSSTLDSIEMLFRGGDAIPGQPIRAGEESALIVADLGKLTVKRTFTPKGSYLFVESKDGARYPSPQKMLDDFLGAISFDPLEFTRMAGKDQYAVIRDMVKIGVDIDALDAANTADEEKRKLAKRDLQNLEGQLAGITIPPVPSAPVDIAEKSKELNLARAVRLEGTQKLQDITTMTAGLERCMRVMDQAQQAFTKAEADLKLAKDGLAYTEKLWEEFKPGVPTKEQVAALEQDIQNAQAINESASAYKYAVQQKEQVTAKVTAKDAEINALTTAIEGRREEKARAIAEAKMPIKGLALQDGQVYFNNLPFNQASTAEQTRVATAIAIAANPTLRVIRIKDASVIDDKGMEVLRKMAKDHDMQIWCETVRTNDPMAVIIEDGKVAGAKEEVYQPGEKPTPVKRGKKS